MRINSSPFRLLAVLAATILLPGAAVDAQTPSSINARMSGNVSPVHDPSIIKQGDTYYVFNTSQANEPPGLIHIRKSRDLVTWERAGAVFPTIPDWAKREVSGTKGIWAPDISFTNGQYRVYYAVSTFGSNHSAIGMASSPTLDSAAPGYGWTDHGAVLVSHHNDDFNAIDPGVFTDHDGKQWMAFGSFWSGIKMVRLDPATGMRSDEDKKVYALAQRRAPDAVEAPVLMEHGGYYYLFVSFDFCCRGVDSSYYTVVGRSKAVTGPYVDYDGKSLMEDHGQIVLHADLDKTKRFKGPGGASLLHDGGQDYIVYHAYDAQHGGAPTLRIQRLGWTADGWPVAI